MSGKQKETLEWLDELELYAKEKQLSMRILDSIEECRQNVASENVNWDKVNFQIEELLESIGKKALPDTVQMNEGDNEVSVKAVEDELKSMVNRCRAENETSIHNLGNRKNIIIKNLFIKLQDITRVKAHLEEMKNEDLYYVFFQRAKSEYRNNFLTMLREMLQDISNNYGQMMERMKSMLQSIKAYKHGLSSERLYHEYDSRKGGLDSRIQNEMEMLETGGEEIESFGRRTRETIGPIVQKLERKRKILAWLPVILVVCILLGGVVITPVIAAKTAEESGGWMDKAKYVWETLQKVMDIGGKVASAAGSIAIIAIFLILVVVVIYALYLLFLKMWCNNQICKQCGKYLKDELAVFEQNNTLLSQMNDVITSAMEEYEEQYVALLNELLAGSSFDPDSKEKQEVNRFASIQNGWNAIKYK